MTREVTVNHARSCGRARSRVAAWLVGCCLAGAVGPVAAAIISVPADYGTIQEAIDAALAGDEILVSEGTYNESIRFVGKAITVRSLAGLDVTILEPGGGAVVTFADGEDQGSVLDGFTITGGTGDTSAGIARGGGIYIEDASPRVLNCTVVANQASDGGGLYVEGAAAPLFSNCRMIENVAVFTGGGGACVGGATPEFVDCVLLGNEALSGGGLWLLDANTIVRSTSFADNISTLVGGGAAAVEGSVWFSGCVFDHNVAAKGGGLICDGSAVDLVRTGFWQNASETQGGAIHCQGNPALTIEHCTIAYNAAAIEGGALYAPSASELIIRNSILAGNYPMPFNPVFTPVAIVTYSRVPALTMDWDWLLGEGVLEADPEFADAASDDFSLQDGSPCIDAGDPASLPDPDGTVADMGAFYYQASDHRFLRGDCNGDGKHNVGDAVFSLLVLFPEFDATATCLDACDSNDDGLFNVADVIYSLSALFSAGAPTPPAPFLLCDEDPTPDPMDCSDGFCP